MQWVQSTLGSADGRQLLAQGEIAGLPLQALVLTTQGWRANGDLLVGERLVDPDGGHSVVTAVHAALTTDVYYVTLQDGSAATASGGQRWQIQTRDSNNRRKVENVTTNELKQWAARKYCQVLLPRSTPHHYDVADALPVHPYLLGILLAEGSLSQETLTFATADPPILARVASLLPSELSIKTIGVKHRISAGNWGGAQVARNVTSRNTLITALRSLGLWGTRSHTKFIPQPYLLAREDERLDVLRGVLDGDGSINKAGHIRFCTSSPQLAEDVRALIWSLGGRAKIVTKRDRTYRYNDRVRASKDEHWIHGVGGLALNPFWLPRKAERFEYSPKSDSYSRKVVGVEHAGMTQVRRIEVSNASGLILACDNIALVSA